MIVCRRIASSHMTQTTLRWTKERQAEDPLGAGVAAGVVGAAEKTLLNVTVVRDVQCIQKACCLDGHWASFGGCGLLLSYHVM